MEFETKFVLIAITVMVCLSAVNVLLILSINEKLERIIRERKKNE